ncbi:hypothetical protein BPAE_0194g00150 [Botrytis paeoniae]|uniref:Uncharacterized protein n=1 Tax=Botrytis paeoniae TaxID=278948 RepID=A0A4Z1FAU8_9HELO|nr:hypothetical protein BPAE_0194g00150 [Botrytis paeoniae]
MSKALSIYEPFEGNTKEEFDAQVPQERDFCYATTVDGPYIIRYITEEWKIQIGPLPDKEIKFASTYKNFFKDYYPRQIESEKFYDQDAYIKCPNYRRYLEESRDGFESTVRQRERCKKQAAEDEIAALAVLKKLSLDEKGKVKD